MCHRTGPAGGQRRAERSGSPPDRSFAADSTMGKIKAAGKLVCGVKFDVIGFGFRNPTTNEVEGLDADLCREIAKAIGVEPEFVEAVSANRIPFLKEDKVDIVISTMTRHRRRKLEIDFSKVYYKAGQSILVKAGAGIKSVADLARQEGLLGPGLDLGEERPREGGRGRLLLFKTYTRSRAGAHRRPLRRRLDRRHDPVRPAAKNFPGAEVVGGQFTEEPLGIGIKKGKDDLVKFIDQTSRRHGRRRPLAGPLREARQAVHRCRRPGDRRSTCSSRRHQRERRPSGRRLVRRPASGRARVHAAVIAELGPARSPAT